MNIEQVIKDILEIIKFNVSIQQSDRLKEVINTVYNQGVVDGKTNKDF